MRYFIKADRSRRPNREREREGRGTSDMCLFEEGGQVDQNHDRHGGGLGDGGGPLQKVSLSLGAQVFLPVHSVLVGISKRAAEL